MKLLVLGLGNLLLRDDGAGVRAVQALAERFQTLPEGVEIVDGGTLGMALLGQVAEADAAILVDAVAADAAAGTLVRFADEEVPQVVAARLSPHQVGVADLLLAARHIGRHPRRLVLCGVVPAEIELGVGLTPDVEAALPELCEVVIEECARLGVPLGRAADAEAARAT